MSSKPTGLNFGLQNLLDEGFEVEVRQQHLLVHSVPYVTSDRELRRGTLVCTFIESAGTLLPPDNHQVWWTGQYPCFASGARIAHIENENNRQELFRGCTIQHRFSNKPEGFSNFSDHYSKMVHYITILQDQAKAIDPNADARTGRVIEPVEGTSVFRYADTASARAEIMMTSSRLGIGRVAIIGLGGTGSYVLDQVAKTPVSEIHLFDGDKFLQHNAFRSPGAAKLEDLAKLIPKSDYFQRIYDAMHRGIVSHPYYLTELNLGELTGFDFIFVCVDNGGTRSMLSQHIQSLSVPFVDVGMNIQLVPDSRKLIGTCRTTLNTPTQKDHFAQYVPMDEVEQDVLYRQNIQVADMNALNAQLAVMKWKQLFGFYADDFNPHNMTFSVNSMSLTRDVLVSPPEP
ncbi:ThiF family adenylyltransferase [Rhodoferax fermentans]|uniref:Uncharacterized protein n=1 Tax=Rhodoferax fermentans TaxID=28066 RepID=A0A1T1ASM2_RHOFE|nr:ThiF family adenylyltransferase [Rhodoferax fermentans]MBK1684223.1 hypothetical protein [Rhodoferax fermentans]OOV07090.1 hypothetical protein RF819_10440 [Rhodoferax fermentans]